MAGIPLNRISQAGSEAQADVTIGLMVLEDDPDPLARNLELCHQFAS